MTENLQIYGAGMAGLLAANQLRRFNPIVNEYQKSLPNNHNALLRFRTKKASQATNIPFKAVWVNKLISHAGKLYDQPNMKLSNMYSQKVTGKVMPRSINNLDPVERYIAPSNYISQMANCCTINYNAPLTREILETHRETKTPAISTIPMPMLMDMVGWPDKPDFEWLPIWSVRGRLSKPVSDVYNTVYYPDFTDSYYRISITGDVVIAEYIRDPMGEPFKVDLEACLAREFGIYDVDFGGGIDIHHQEYGKLIPIDDKARKEFILYMTDKYGIYSLGRFATWRQLLMDDVVDDINLIENLIEYRDDYNRTLISAGVAA